MPQEEQQFEQEFGNEIAPLEQQEADPTLAPESLKDRRHRRLEKALQESKDMNIALAERVKVLSETERFQQEVRPDEDVHAMLFGSAPETDETRQSVLAVQKVLEKNAKAGEERAFKRASEAFKESQAQVAKEIDENTQYLNEELENIEDRFNIDLSGQNEESKKLRNGFIDYVAKFSRKDRDGNITDYPDIQATWEEYNSRRQSSTNTRARNIASRSMTQSAGGDAASDSEKKALEKYMLENGFI